MQVKQILSSGSEERASLRGDVSEGCWAPFQLSARGLRPVGLFA